MMKITEAQAHKLICQICILGLVGTSVIAICDGMDKNHYDRRDEQSVAQVYRDPDIKVTHHDFVDNSEKVFSEKVFTENKFNNPITTKTIDKKLKLDCGIGRTEKYTTTSVYKEFVAESNELECNDVSCDSINADNSCKYVSLSIPNGDCSSFMFMDYRALTDISSKQWELQQYAYDGNYGIRMVDGCYCVATSSMYGDVGDKIRVTTDRGNSYWCIIADIKGYDSVGGWYHVNSQGTINLIEFVVDSNYIPNECWQMGDMGVIDNIGGNVIKIERLS